MKLSKLLLELLNDSDFTQKSLEEQEVLGEKFLTVAINAKSGTMKKLDRAFDALTSNVELSDFLAAIEFIKSIKAKNHFL